MEYTLDSFVVTRKLINSEKVRKLVFKVCVLHAIMMLFKSKVILIMKYSVLLVCTEAQMQCLIISQDDHKF